MDIDFIIPWVDGSDPIWIEEFNEYSPKKKNLSIDILNERYRENGLLRYWFRGIEKNAPWVRKIFFVTSGQKPEWLNLNHHKLVWVKHSDFIPQEYLPTFSCRPIHIHLHKIKGLSDNFVLFDDDMYILNPINKDYYFKYNLPKDYALLRPIKIPDFYSHVIINNMIEVNKHFNKSEVMKKNLGKYFNFRYGLRHFIPTYYISRVNNFPGFFYKHFSQPFLRNTFEDVWHHCSEVLEATSHNRFRTIADVSSGLFRYWQLSRGNFSPETPGKHRRKYNVSISNVRQIQKTIENKYIKELCLNDTDCPDECYLNILESFDKIFPQISSFEV
ncbi:MAG: stealth family protein [Defluviitaleaceae bacterium]|nr:stealth family protein [Defluviitaleaceae bacterium]